MLAGLRAPKMLTERLRPPEPRSERCLNCEAPLAGPFCAQCGQRDIPPYPSVRELVTDAFWELSGWDGRFAATVRALLQAPGRLTTEFLEGRRARYISPLRLYLVSSLVYFLVAASAPNLRPGGGVEAPGISIGAGKPAASRVADAANDAVKGDITVEERAAALKDIERAPKILRPILRRAVTDPAGFKRGILSTMPRVLFALVPVFAAIVGLFFRGRKYPEHLYFALHLQAFVFAALTAGELFKFSYSVTLASVAGVAAGLWIAVYAVKALRHVYGEPLGRTILKAIGIAALNAIAGGVSLLLVVYWAALFA